MSCLCSRNESCVYCTPSIAQERNRADFDTSDGYKRSPNFKWKSCPSSVRQRSFLAIASRNNDERLEVYQPEDAEALAAALIQFAAEQRLVANTKGIS